MADDQIQVTITADASGMTETLQTAATSAQVSFQSIRQAAQTVNVQINELAPNAQKNLKTAKSATDNWTKSFANLDHAFSSSITGMVLGTETWQKAVRRLSQTALTDLVNLAQKRLAQWLASELGMTTATEAGTAARTAAEQSANTTSLASVALKALQMIATDAAQTFAGVFAFLAPALGPAAAGPAAASQATVLEAGNMVVAAGGLWNVPSTCWQWYISKRPSCPRISPSRCAPSSPAAAQPARAVAAATAMRSPSRQSIRNRARNS